VSPGSRTGLPAGVTLRAGTDDDLGRILAVHRAAQPRTAAEGETVLVVEGDWRYYERFDFTAAEDLGLRRPHDGITRRCFMVLALVADAQVPRRRFVNP
jgi:predicted N-acetyltransferase YhbS